MKKRLIDGLIGILIGVVVILFLTPKHEDIGSLLKKKDKEHAEKIKSLNEEAQQLQSKDKLLMNTIQMLMRDKDQIAKEKEIYRKEYERIKNSPVFIGHFTNDQVDSLLSTIYPR